MSEIRVNFLNWRPDADEFQNDGLTEAQNVIHEPEGYKPAHLQTSTSFFTTGGLASVTSIVSKPVGAQDDVFSAWISANTLNVGVNGVTMTSSTTGHPLSFSSSGSNQHITFLDVTDFGNVVFFVASAEQDIDPFSTPAVETLRAVGYVTITSV